MSMWSGTKNVPGTFTFEELDFFESKSSLLQGDITDNLSKIVYDDSGSGGSIEISLIKQYTSVVNAEETLSSVADYLVSVKTCKNGWDNLNAKLNVRYPFTIVGGNYSSLQDAYAAFLYYAAENSCDLNNEQNFYLQ